MTAHVPDSANRSDKVFDGIEVQRVKNHVEVTGVSEVEVREALRLRRKVIEIRTDARRTLEDYLNQTMLQSDENLISSSTQRQVKRTTALRQSLLADHGAETYDSLAELRDAETSSVRAWVARARDRGDLFTIKVKGRILIPRVQLDDRGDLDVNVISLVQPLLQAGLDGWSLWAWLTSPTGRLSGGIPAEVVTRNPARAQKAADLYAADLEQARGDAA